LAQAPVMPLFTDALIGDTMHLSAAEFGAYMLILIATWRNNGQALPDNDVRLARIAKTHPRNWPRVRDAIVGFFDLSGGTWTQKRLVKEWLRVTNWRLSQSAKGTRSAEARALKRHDTGSTGVDGGLQPNGQPNSTILNLNHIKKEERETHTGVRVSPESTELDMFGSSARKKRAPNKPQNSLSGIPADWRPDSAGVAYARKHGVSRDEVDKFRDYHLARGSQYADWSATWRTWVRRSRQYAQESAGDDRSV
jgi:uncharacterized protein YdaU (DUF1376 family)